MNDLDGGTQPKKDNHEPISVISRWNVLNSVFFLVGGLLVIIAVQTYFRSTAFYPMFLIFALISCGFFTWILVRNRTEDNRTSEYSALDFYSDLLFFVPFSYCVCIPFLLLIHEAIISRSNLTFMHFIEFGAGAAIMIFAYFTKTIDYLVKFTNSAINEYISTCKFKLVDGAIAKCDGPVNHDGYYGLPVHFANGVVVDVSWKNVNDPTVLLIKGTRHNGREQIHLLKRFKNELSGR